MSHLELSLAIIFPRIRSRSHYDNNIMWERLAVCLSIKVASASSASGSFHARHLLGHRKSNRIVLARHQRVGYLLISSQTQSREVVEGNTRR